MEILLLSSQFVVFPPMLPDSRIQRQKFQTITTNYKNFWVDKMQNYPSVSHGWTKWLIYFVDFMNRFAYIMHSDLRDLK